MALKAGLEPACHKDAALTARGNPILHTSELKNKTRFSTFILYHNWTYDIGRKSKVHFPIFIVLCFAVTRLKKLAPLSRVELLSPA